MIHRGHHWLRNRRPDCGEKALAARTRSLLHSTPANELDRGESMSRRSSRRDFLGWSVRGAAGVLAFRGLPVPAARAAEDASFSPPPIEGEDLSAKAPTAPVAIERAKDFDIVK